MITCRRHLFDIPERIHYLNCAYMGPLLRQTTAIGKEAVERKARPYLIEAQDFFTPVKELKHTFARMLQIDEPGRIALIPSVSYGLANVARNVPLEKGRQIIVLDDQFPSNYYVWQRLAVERGAKLHIVPAPAGPHRSRNWNDALLSAIDDRTALVAMPHVHWADGTLFNLAAVRKATEKVGAMLVIDGTQSVGALPFDMAKFRPDALVVAGYKWLLGPYGMGLAYYGPRFDEGLPIEENWINRRNSEDFRQLVNYQEAYQPLAGRYSVGEQSNFMLVPMLRHSLEQIMEWGVAAVQEYCSTLIEPYLPLLAEMGVNVEAPGGRAAHLFGLRLSEDFDLAQLKKEMERRSVHVSFRGNSIRVSPHLYNQAADLDALLDALKAARPSVGRRSVKSSL